MHPILLLHGALASEAQLLPLQAMLHPDAAFVITFSGHGTRAEEPLDFERFVQDIEDAMRQRSLQRVHLFGYSMGGYAAVLFAARYPERVASVVTLGTIFTFTPEGLQKELRMLDPDVMEQKVPAFAAKLAEQHGVAHWRQVVTGIAARMADLAHSPLITTDVIQRVECPVRCLVGDADSSAGPERTRLFADQLPKATSKVLPTTRHPFEDVDLNTLVPELRGFWTEAEAH